MYRCLLAITRIINGTYSLYGYHVRKRTDGRLCSEQKSQIWWVVVVVMMAAAAGGCGGDTDQVVS